jgi:leucyl aminopeptidase (aminopeptidase T)
MAVRSKFLEGGLTPQQENAIVGLINETSVAAAARASGVGQRTLHKWINDDDRFMAAYRAARRHAFDQAIALTQRYASLAVTTLAKVMADASAPHTAKVSAATAMLRFGRESIEMDDLCARVEALEADEADERARGASWGAA